MSYRYRSVGNYLVPADLTVRDALRIFRFGFDAFYLQSLGLSKRFVRKLIRALLLAKFRKDDPACVVCLPVSAHLAIPVHHGYKLFDFERSAVTKVFASGVSPGFIANEISAARTAASVPLAPRFLSADEDSGWYAEEYIPGVHATTMVSSGSSAYQRYYEDAERCLLQLITQNAPTSISVQSHLDSLTNHSFRDRWMANGAAIDEVDRISGFQRALRDRLIAETVSDTLVLVTTHGDFSLVNAIVTDAGLRFIDWEGIRSGSIFSDMYNFMLVEKYYGRATEDFQDEFHAMIGRYRSALADHGVELSRAAKLPERFARRLYYLERLHLLIERDVSVNLRKVVAKSIELFRTFDVEMGDKPI